LTARRSAILIWIIVIIASAVEVGRLRIDTDMTAFLPRSASPAQQILVEQFRDGVVSRLVLVAIEGTPVAQSAAIGKDVAARLRGSRDFVTVENGEEGGFEHDREFLWSNRYLLSDRINAAAFTRTGLRAVLEQDLADLGSATGFLVKRMLAADPTGEMLYLIGRQQADGGPARQDGVWMSPDGKRALMLVRLRAAGSDIDAAQDALAQIRSAFNDAATSHQASEARLLLTGPPVFAVEARDRIKSDATRLSTLASLLVAGTLLAVYRSPRVLVLAFVPVATGALAGIAAVGLVFRTVHGITLGFGATLIGEAVDYAVYLFTQTAPDSPVEHTLQRIWPTLRLGVLTSICGFSAMLLSSFDGFAQLGLFTITGLATAVCVTRWVLPVLIPARFAGVRQSRTMLRIATVAANGRRVRKTVPLIILAAAVFLAAGQGPFWAGDLTSLSPVPLDEQHLDQALRQDIGAPDVSYLIVIRRPDQEAALQAAERVATSVDPLIRQGALAGLDTPARYLPSLAAQQARQATLPDQARLQAELDAASQGLPFQLGLFAPFVSAVAKARSADPVNRSSLEDTSLSLKLDSLLQPRPDGMVAMVSLRGVTDPQAIEQAIAGEPDAVLVNLKAESDRLLAVYLREAGGLAILGAAAIVLLLAASLRSFRRLIAVTAPLAASVMVTLAILRFGDHALSIFNLFGMLLVVAVGSNYCLFLDRVRGQPDGAPRVLASLLLANACTVAGFGVLALSRTPVLHDLGVPVAIGTLLSLVFATILMSPVPFSRSADAATH
jgi:predicted exporter